MSHRQWRSQGLEVGGANFLYSEFYTRSMYKGCERRPEGPESSRVSDERGWVWEGDVPPPMGRGLGRG